MWFCVENSILVLKLGWETSQAVKLVLFWGTTFHLKFFQHWVTPQKSYCPFQNSSSQPLFKKEVKKNPSETLYRCDFAWSIRFWCRNWGEKPSKPSHLGFFGAHFSLEIFSKIESPSKKFMSARKLIWRCVLWRTLPRPLILKAITIVSK